MRKSIYLLALLFVAAFAAAQDSKPRVAIIPFNHISVSKADSDALTNLFETALVTTEVFQVIEQTQINDILAAQEFSVSDCTDEACAVEFGKLLSAEQIILGTVSTVGGKYILTAKIIDVTTGRNLKADKAQANSLGDLTDAVEPLAYKMAGLTVQRGTETVIAKEFGEVFVETNPSEADILINGVPKGKSPNLFTRVPVGKVLVESRKGNLYGSAEVEVTGTMKKVSIELAVVQGNLFIASTDKQVQVYLDGQLLGPFGSGLFEKVAVGQHVLELKGTSSYSRDEIEVKEGESAKVEAFPRPFGTLEYRLPEGVSAEVVSPTFREVIRGTGKLSPLWADSYTVTAKGGDYKPYQDKVQIERGTSTAFAPTLEFSEEYLARANLKAEIEKLEAERQVLEKRIAALGRGARAGGAGKWVSLTGGVVGLGLSGLFYGLGSLAYDHYLAAGETDWQLYKKRFQTLDVASLASVSAGAVGVLGSVILWIATPKSPEKMAQIEEGKRRLAEIDETIARLAAEVD